MTAVSGAQTTWRVVAAGHVAGMATLHRRAVAEIRDAAIDLGGAVAARRLAAGGIAMLHEALAPTDIGPLRDRVLDRLRDDLLRFAVETGRTVLGWRRDFYVDDYLILRINLPYEVARNADPAAENPGIGRLSAGVRALAASRRVTDPNYDPRAYHRGMPPAAWAHGPHVDTWTGHSRGGVNLWWAMCDVPAEAGMVLYPELAGESLPCDPKTLYVRGGYPLPPPTYVPLKAGEMLVFDPEILHGTHLNVSGGTRIAISLRLNAQRPVFDPDCFYAREFWRRAGDITSGDLATVLHVKREEHLAAPAPFAPSRTIAPPVEIAAVPDASGRAAVCAASTLAEHGRVIARLPGARVLIGRHAGALYAIDAACPHYGLELADGGVRDGVVSCPGCAVGFAVATGRSASDALRLHTFAVRDEAGTIVLDAAPRDTRSA